MDEEKRRRSGPERLLASIRRLHQLEAQRRSLPFTSPEFAEVTKRIEEQTERVYSEAGIEPEQAETSEEPLHRRSPEARPPEASV